MTDFSIELTENALDSLVHGIEHLTEDPDNKRDLKYAILHVAQAAELFLKARLAKEHPLLIYDEPWQNGVNGRTVNMDTAMKRLLAAGVKLSSEQQDHVKSLQGYRNRIQHHCISECKGSVKVAVGSAIHFVENFVQAELGIVLREKIESDLYRDMLQVTGAYETRRKEAHERLSADLAEVERDGGDYQLYDCPECGEHETAPYPDPRKGVLGPECYVCGAQVELNDCAMCGARTQSTFCDYCSRPRRDD